MLRHVRSCTQFKTHTSELIGMEYLLGSGVEASKLCMDKVATGAALKDVRKFLLSQACAISRQILKGASAEEFSLRFQWSFPKYSLLLFLHDNLHIS